MELNCSLITIVLKQICVHHFKVFTAKQILYTYIFFLRLATKYYVLKITGGIHYSFNLFLQNVILGVWGIVSSFMED